MMLQQKISKLRIKSLIREELKRQGIILTADFSWGVDKEGNVCIYQKDKK
jgi:hypothetical protein